LVETNVWRNGYRTTFKHTKRVLPGAIGHISIQRGCGFRHLTIAWNTRSRAGHRVGDARLKMGPLSGQPAA
jgi:hypothetical protein